MAADIATSTNDQSEQLKTTEASEPANVAQRVGLALVGADVDAQSDQQDVLDRVFETTGHQSGVASNVRLSDIDSLFETSFSVDL